MNKRVSLFLDSGAHSLYTKYVITKQHQEGYNFYESKEFWDYVDAYSRFVKKYQKVIDIYVSVDVIFNPELSWKVQKYMETEHGLSPMPVVHHGTDLKWLKRYIDAGHKYIGLGGLGQEVTRAAYVSWADKAFTMICDTPDNLPRVKIHGFAMTSLKLMMRYPWYSVDSTSWVITGRMGSVYVPRHRDGKYIYDENSWKICVSERSPSKKDAGQHLSNLSPKVQEVILNYFKHKGFALGESEFRWEDDDYKPQENERWFGKAKDERREVELIVEPGLCNKYQLRDELNIIYFLDLEKSMPEWPWPFRIRKQTLL